MISFFSWSGCMKNVYRFSILVVLIVISLGSPSSKVTNAKTLSGDKGAANLVPETTFSNTNPITIPLVGNASPYPSSIAVSGLSGTITSVTVTLTGFNHTFG